MTAPRRRGDRFLRFRRVEPDRSSDRAGPGVCQFCAGATTHQKPACGACYMRLPYPAAVAAEAQRRGVVK